LTAKNGNSEWKTHAEGKAVTASNGKTYTAFGAPLRLRDDGQGHVTAETSGDLLVT
jgi:hypothetical protein